MIYFTLFPASLRCQRLHLSLQVLCLCGLPMIPAVRVRVAHDSNGESDIRAYVGDMVRLWLRVGVTVKVRVRLRLRVRVMGKVGVRVRVRVRVRVGLGLWSKL